MQNNSGDFVKLLLWWNKWLVLKRTLLTYRPRCYVRKANHGK
jgi:hypothetical protein